ncbi:MAG TPA: hypothetical protein VL422_14250 [Miltoncostaea sp.]|jgi:hypothetical protein|nr:hypothetical protein [Miltoncostaea sp.]
MSGGEIDPTSPRARRMRANEELMEELNRRMERLLDDIREQDDEDRDAPIAFLCECSHLDCRERIEMEPSRFDRIHQDPEQFILVSGHEIPDVERVVDQFPNHLVVRKLV